MAESAVEQQEAKASQKERKRQKALKKESPTAARKKLPHALLRRAGQRSKHGGLPPRRPGRRTMASGQHGPMPPPARIAVVATVTLRRAGQRSNKHGGLPPTRTRKRTMASGSGQHAGSS
jgi:hypothetical protein